MRAPICSIFFAAICLVAIPASAQVDLNAAVFWKAVQARCDATAVKTPGQLGLRIARTAIREFTLFGGHQIDSNGRLFHFGLTEAENEKEDGSGQSARLGDLGWWRVMKYWRSLYDNEVGDKLEVRGYRDASKATNEALPVSLLRSNVGELMHAAEAVADPNLREILLQAILRSAVTDTPWSAAFVSYVIKQSGVAPNAFQFANAHRVFIYDAFATSAAEEANVASERLYRACPLTTRPRPGDLICQQREPALADASDEAVRERIRAELVSHTDTRSVRHTHCEVVAYIDRPARKVYTIGGNVNQSVTARKLNLRNDLKFSAVQKGNCGGAGHWTLPLPSANTPGASSPVDTCSLNDKKWFVLLQAR